MGWKFPNPNNNWGYPFDAENTNDRQKLTYDTIESKLIGPNTAYAYGHTGKQNEWAGMEATVEIWAKAKADATASGEKVCKVFYSCPWSGSNQLKISDKTTGWSVEDWGADFNGDALGSVTMEVRKI